MNVYQGIIQGESEIVVFLECTNDGICCCFYFEAIIETEIDGTLRKDIGYFVSGKENLKETKPFFTRYFIESH